MEQKSLFKVRDKRNKGWFFIDNEYLNGYARIFGAIGTAVYVSLCRHADNETQTCFPSMQLISEELNISRGTVNKYLKLFEKYRIIQKIPQKRNAKQQWINNEYTLLDKEEWVKHESRVQPLNTDSRVQLTAEPCATDDKSRVQPLNTKDTHINYTHNKDTHSKAVALQGKDWNELIDSFKEVNPLYEEFYKNTTERKALEYLVSKLGLDKVKSVIKHLPEIINQPYAPKITKPTELKRDLGKLIAFYKQNQNKYKKIVVI